MEVLFDNQKIFVAEGQTLLSALIAGGHHIPHNCCAGACQSCLMQAVTGVPPAASQEGLKDSLKAQNYFLACICKPDAPLTVALAPQQNLLRATLVDRLDLSPSVLRLRLQSAESFDYRAGQYITLFNSDVIGRSYSLASVSGLDDFLELHVHLIPNGAVSAWLHDKVLVGDPISLQGPLGDCFYIPGEPEQNLLLVGTGTGLAPLVGVARDALHQGHRGEIHLIHGALQTTGLYLHQTLLELAVQFDNFHYHASVLHPSAEDVGLQGWSASTVEALSQQVAPKPQGWKIYLAGNPDMVNNLRKQLFLAGASSRNIYADPFTIPLSDSAL